MSGFARSFRRYMMNATVFDGFVALSVADPLDDLSGFVEANTIGVGGYARQPVVWDRSQPLPVAGQPAFIANTSALTWTSTAPWNLTRAVAWVIAYDFATGAVEGSFTGWAPLSPAKLVDRAGITITIPAGALKLTLGLQLY